MALNFYQKLCYRALGKRFKRDPKFDIVLKKADIGVIGEAYKSFVWFTFILLLVIPLGLLLSLLLSYSSVHQMSVTEVLYTFFTVGIDFQALIGDPLALIIIILEVFLVFVPLITFLYFLHMPRSKIKQRGKRITRALPSALSFVSAMAATTITPIDIFRSLSRQKAFGEIAREAKRIYLDMSTFGKDSMSALKSAIDRSVSTEWREFLQGMISTINSGGNLRAYFNAKALESMQGSRERLRAAISGMSVMAESYVTVGVAFPIFLIILLIAMSVMASSMNTSLLTEVVVFLLIPLIELAFGWILYSMAKEVS